MLDPELGAEPVELAIGRGRVFAQAEQAVREFFAVIGERPGDRHWGGAVKVAEEPAALGRCLRRIDTHEDPMCGGVIPNVLV